MENVQHSKSASSPSSAEKKALLLENQINDQINEIWAKIQRVNPEYLLRLSSNIEMMGILADGDELTSEMQVTPFARPTEYIQSVIAASPQCAQAPAVTEDTETACMEIIADIESLSNMILTYTLWWAGALKNSIEDSELLALIVEAQTMYQVRGNRYQLFQKDYFTPLLIPHDEKLRTQFGLSADELISGLMSLEHALSQGRIEGICAIGELFDRYVGSNLSNLQDIPQGELNTLQEAFSEAFSPEHYNVARITEWPLSFIDALAYSPGEATWYEQGKYRNWPIVSLPIQTKPFIRLNERTYCFDYYSLFDNFYRTLQKTILEQDPSYVQTWQIKQNEASESFVTRLFSNLLPGCICYTSNYYPREGKKGQLSENDLIIQFHDILIIVEVKAGSFTFAPPITDWEKHVRDYKALIEKADHQCARTRKYLSEAANVAILLDSQGHEKAQIDMSIVSDIFEISITIDDINTFASKAERLSFLSLQSGAISISINDLMVYEDYFDNPFQFMHFLKQRRCASRNSQLVFNDELDHLGMYIENNLYATRADDRSSHAPIIVMNFRDDLDRYYSQARQHGLDVDKPQQETMPDFFLEALAPSCIPTLSNPVQFTSFLLNFAGEARSFFANQIGILFDRALLRERAQILNTSGNNTDKLSLRMSCFIEASADESKLDIADCRNYASSMMLANCDKDRHLLALSFDSQGHLRKATYEYLTPACVSADDRQYLLNMGKQRASGFIEEYKLSHRKIGRNEPCPCGSGRKYKKCHGR